jgi:hypothetical protein
MHNSIAVGTAWPVVSLSRWRGCYGGGGGGGNDTVPASKRKAERLVSAPPDLEPASLATFTRAPSPWFSLTDFGEVWELATNMNKPLSWPAQARMQRTMAHSPGRCAE